ncbi:hypothetical protein EDC01DRAFT_651235 [Geopyxis carbonaria]|nr:hypothetical protein EDC01DRAFT_651235 [Geopyxis carbonaria]
MGNADWRGEVRFGGVLYCTFWCVCAGGGVDCVICGGSQTLVFIARQADVVYDMSDRIPDFECITTPLITLYPRPLSSACAFTL